MSSLAIQHKWERKPIQGTILNRSHPFAKGLISFWALNSGRDPAIDSARNHTLDHVSAPPWGTSVGEQAFILDGSADYLQAAAHSTDFDFGTGEYTFAVKVRTTNTGATDVFLSSYSTAGWWLGKVGGNVARFTFNGTAYEGSTNITDGQYHTVIATRKDGTVYLAVDGVIETSGAQTGSADGDGPMTLGSFGEVGGFEWPGDIVFGAIWDRGFGANEIKEFSENPWQVFQPQTHWVDTSVAAAGGLDIPIAAYHHNHNIGSHL